MTRARPSLGGLALGGLALGSLGACSRGAPGEPAGTNAPAEQAPPAGAASEEQPEAPPRFRFTDVTAEAGLAGFRQVNGSAEKPYLTETIGGGVALADLDGDGDLDAYFTNGSAYQGFRPGSEPHDGLYWNDGKGHFRDGTHAAGLGDTEWTCGVRVADLDGDGLPEIYLTNHGPNVLYRNRGDGTFEDVTARAGVGDPRWSTGACFLDFDRDGDLDLYVSNYVAFDRAAIEQQQLFEDFHGIKVNYGPRGLPGEHDAFYVAAGDGTFRDASADVGIAGPAYYGFQCVTFDLDVDGWPDVYVADDSEANLMWRNDRDGHFVDVGLRSALALNQSGAKQAGMGVCVGDYDGDLRPDVFVTNFSEDYFTLYRGVEGGFFTDASFRARIAGETKPYLGWGCGFVDFDADGDLDLYTVDGHVYPQVDDFPLGLQYRQEKLLFENLGDGRFRRARAGAAFDAPQAGRGSAVGDVDGDGDPDLLVESIDGPPELLRNDTPDQGGRVVLELVGRGVNRDAIGARVVGRVGSRRFLALVGTASGFLSTDDRRLYLGLGTAARIDELTITWPEGDEEHVTDLAAGRSYRVEAGKGIVSSAAFAGD